MGDVRPREAKTKVFISYSGNDADFAETLAADLEMHGFDAYIDTADIVAGEPWKECIVQIIGAADVFVFGISPSVVRSEVCLWELGEATKMGKKILPVLFRRVEASAVPSTLSRLNWVDLSHEPVDEGLAKLVSAAEMDIGWTREHTRYGELARAWEQSGRRAHDVLRGDTLVRAETWLPLRPRGSPEPDALQMAFIGESRWVFDAEVAANRENVDRALSGQSLYLSGLADAAGDDFVTAMLLALEALPSDVPGRNHPYVPEAEATLMRSCLRRREILVLGRHEDEVNRATFSPDGGRILTA